MRAGARDRVVTLQVVTETRDNVGQPVKTWTTVRTLRVQRVEGSRVTERFAGNQTYAQVTTIFRGNWYPGYETVKPNTHQLLFEGKAYNIQGVVEIGRRKGVEYLCFARGET